LTDTVNVRYIVPVAKALNNLLRDLRESNGKTLRQTAKDLEVNPAYLSRVERGEKPASRAIQHRLAAYYEVEPEVIEVATGQLPDDVVRILQDHPDAIERLRKQYGAS
jgi:HTH-type transcriptional regulator, competence development regulator